MKKYGWWIGLMISLFILSGCQSLMTQMKAAKAMQQGRYAEAVSLLGEVLAKDENNVEALKGLGETYLRMKKGAEAEAALEKAHGLSPGDKVAGINLGLAYNMNGRYDKALALWRPYVEKEPDSNLSALLRKQITLALYKDAAKRAKEAVQQEAALQAIPGAPNALAVTYFGDQGLTAERKPLRKAIAAMLITDLSKTKSLQVVERVRLQKLMEELQLGMSGLVDDKTAPRLGRLLGAGKIVTGNMLVVGEQRMDVNGLLADVLTGSEVGKQDAKGSVKEFFKIEKAIAFGIVRDMGIKLTKAEEDIIGRYATESFTGMLYYGQGLDAQDGGEWDKAIGIFMRCIKEDPNGPCATALRDAPSGGDVEAAQDPAAMSAATAVAAEQDAAAASGGSSGDGGGDGGC